jgi:hypothetical protein
MRELEIKNDKLDTKGMLEEGFLQEYAGKGKGSLNSKPISVLTSDTASTNINTEALLLKAYDVRDTLISSFSDIKLGSSLAINMKRAINEIGNMIVGLGGLADSFDPLSHVSGLTAPSINKYASRVIENTKDSYSLGNIEDARIEGKSIIITFAGKSPLDETSYRAIGTITTNGTWMGNEAIDYVYTPGEGKMSVKVANQKGEWVDQSNNYVVSWELFEGTSSELLTGASKNVEKKDQTKEEEINLIKNNLDSDISDDFLIEEK